jgi:hypothetical protein
VGTASYLFSNKITSSGGGRYQDEGNKSEAKDQ